MRRIIFFIVLPIFLLLLILGVGSLALERYSQTPEMRAQVEKFSSSWLGRPLSYESLRIGLWPPRLSIADASLPGAEPSGPDLLTVHRLDLQVAIGPLLRREVLFESIKIKGLDLRMVRNNSGFDIPWTDSPSPSDSEDASSNSEESWISSWQIRFRRIEVEDTRLALIDQTLPSPETYGFESVNLTAKGRSDFSPLKLNLSARSIGGGGIRATGTSSLSGDVALQVKLSNLSFSGLGSYLEAKFLTDVGLSGQVDLKGPIVEPEQLKFDLQLAGDRLEWESYSLKGQVALKGQFEAVWPTPKGSLSLDGKEAAVVIGEVIDKPSGTPLYLVSSWGGSTGSDPVVSLETIEIATINGGGGVGGEPSFSLQLDSEAFPVTALALLVPELSDSGAHGQLQIKNLIYQAEAPSIQGTVSAEDLHVVFENGGSMSLSADLTGEGDGVAIEKGDFSSGGQHFSISGKVTELEGQLPFDLKIETPQPIRADAFLTGLSPNLSDVLYGPVTLTANLSGSGASL
ncbi:AsmA family protein, partial [Myxococcota bacterium]|nr:AsmA family protein [Myxococcota bacterium]